MNKRGLRAGVEYRYYLDDWSKGTWMVDGLDDRKIDNGIGDASEKWGFEDGGKISCAKMRIAIGCGEATIKKCPGGFRPNWTLTLSATRITRVSLEMGTWAGIGQSIFLKKFSTAIWTTIMIPSGPTG